MATNSNDSAIEYLSKYQEAYSSVTGIRYKIPGKEITSIYDNSLINKVFLEQVRNKHQLNEEQFKEKYLIPFLMEDDFIRHLAQQLVLYNDLSSNSSTAHIPVGTLPTLDFNAAAIKTNNGDRILVLNTGIVVFMSEVLNSFLGTLTTPFLKPLWSQKEAAFRIIQWTIAVSTGTAKFGISKTPFFTDLNLMAASGSVGDNARIFILGHEYGHFFLNHLNDARTEIKQLIPTNDNYPIEYYIKNFVQEFDADMKGFEFCISWCKATHKGKYQVSFFSIIFVFHLLRLIELTTINSNDELTHPPSLLRREKFEEKYYKEFDEETKYKISYLDNFMGFVYDCLEEMNIRL